MVILRPFVLLYYSNMNKVPSVFCSGSPGSVDSSSNDDDDSLDNGLDVEDETGDEVKMEKERSRSREDHNRPSKSTMEQLAD